jgi:flagellin-like protein
MRKGITPVIAVVLLLLITVGAVASAWGLYQEITSDTSQLDQLNKQRQAQATELEFSSVYNANDGINVSIRNTGGRTVNMSDELEMSFIPDGSDSGVSYDVFTSTTGDAKGDLECFQNIFGENESVEPGNSYTCDTGVEFPSATSGVGLVIDYTATGKSWDHTCSPSTSSSITC